MIAVIVRECEIGDVGRLVADRRKLRQQGPGDREHALLGLGTIGFDGAVRNFAGIPHQRALRMRDQETRSDHVRGRLFAFLKSVARAADPSDFSAVEHVKPQRGGSGRSRHRTRSEKQ